MTERLDAFHADVIHIAIEGPLGWAARRYCLKRQLAFTTAFHTKFPEILNAALKIPLSWGYALFRFFHKSSSGVMVPTQGLKAMLQCREFGNLRRWTHGVDTRLFAFDAKSAAYAPRPDLFGTVVRPASLFVGRVSYEKNIDAFLKLDIPDTQVVCPRAPLWQLFRWTARWRWWACPTAASAVACCTRTCKPPGTTRWRYRAVRPVPEPSA